VPIYMQMRKRKFNVCIIHSSKERRVEEKNLIYQYMEGEICLSDFVV